MTREALVELLAKVEAREPPSALEFCQAFWRDDEPALSNERRILAKHSFEGSLDAAKALHEAVLPGWTLDNFGQRAGGWIATVGRRDGKTPRPAPQAMVRDNPARAWLIAILKALIAESKE